MSRFVKKVAAVVSTVVTLASGFAAAAPAFAAAHAVGTNVLSSDGTVWMIMPNNCRRAYTSGGAFLSYGFNSFGQVMTANADDLALPVCAEGFIPPADGTIITADRDAEKDTTYLITGGKKAGFTSAAVFTGLGFKFNGAFGDVSWMSKDSNIDDTTAAHRPGVLVNDNGTVKLVGPTGVLGIPDLMTFNSWGYKFGNVVPANAADKALPMTGVMAARVAGQLNPTALSNQPAPGTLTVSVASDTPAAMTLAGGSANNPVLKLNVSGTGTITGLKLTKTGFLANTNVSGVSVYDGSGVRHGNVISTLGADGVALVTFNSEPITVSGSTSLWVKLNLSSSATSGTIGFNVASAADVLVSSGTVGGTFPVVGNVMTVVSGSSSIATLTVDELPLNSSGITLNVDPTSAQEISKFRIRETSSNEAVDVRGLTIWNNGTAADTDVMDVQLVDQTGNVIATAQQVNKSVKFVLASPYRIDKGQSKDFTVRAKIVNGAARTIQFVVYNDYDLDARGINTQAGLLPAAGSNDTTFPIGDSTSVYNKVTVGSGSVIFSRAQDSPSASTTPGANDVVLAKYIAKPIGENMELRGLSFGIDQDTSAVALTGTVYVKVNDAIVYSAAANTTNFPVAGTASARTLSNYPILTAGQNNVITVTASISSSATAADAYFVNDLDLTSVKRLVTNDITDPGVSAIDGNTIGVKAAALTVTTLATPVASSVVVGTTGFEVARFELNAQASGEDVRVSSVTVTDTLGAGGAYADLANLQMFDATGNPIATSSSTATNANTVAFNFSTPVLVSRTTPVVLVLKADSVTGVTGGSTVTHTYKIGSTASHVVSTGKDTGNSITASVSGNGQAQTLASGGTLTGSLVTGTNATPSVAQLVRVGQTDGVYFSFRLSAQYEAQKVTTLILRAAGTALSQNDIRNIRLYENAATTAFASASQFSSCSSNACSNTWTASDNLLSAPIPAGGSTTITVKADIGAENLSKLGDDFYMKLDMTSGNDITAKGVTSAAAPTYAGGNLNNSSTAVSRIVPFQVVATADYPTSSITTTVGAGTHLARFKVQNNGSAQVTLTSATFTDSGSHTGTDERYTLYASSENSADYTANLLETSASDTFAFGSLASTITINGGSYRYLTIVLSTAGSVAAGNTYGLSISTLGNLTFSVAESALGYDGEQDSDITGTITGLYVDGKPVAATITKQ